MRPALIFMVFAVASWIIWGFNVSEVSTFWAGYWWLLNCGLSIYAAVWVYVAATERT